MHRFDPKSCDFAYLVDGCLSQISIGKFDVQFEFEKARFCVQSRVEILLSDGQIARWREDCGWDSTLFQRILNLNVVAIRVLSPEILEIEMQDKARIRIWDESDQYESVQVYRPSMPIMVI
jgi:hypothetical protein